MVDGRSRPAELNLFDVRFFCKCMSPPILVDRSAARTQYINRVILTSYSSLTKSTILSKYTVLYSSSKSWRPASIWLVTLRGYPRTVSTGHVGCPSVRSRTKQAPRRTLIVFRRPGCCRGQLVVWRCSRILWRGCGVVLSMLLARYIIIHGRPHGRPSSILCMSHIL